jgi:curved DNA-binding protein CbpA
MQEMRKHAEETSGQNYYQILGVDPSADRATIQAAFFGLAKTWHPDRIGPELEDIRDLASRTFARMSEAHQILTDDERRHEYDALLKQGGGSAEEQEQVARVLRAVMHFQKAEVLLKKGNGAEAALEVAAAVENDPEYVALHVWLQAQAPERVQSGQYEDLIKRLSAVITQHSNHERARYYRAQIYKRAGKAEKAIKDFLWITEHNPKHLDAAREVRLYRMRKGDDRSGSGEAKDRGSLLDKIFKR